MTLKLLKHITLFYNHILYSKFRYIKFCIFDSLLTDVTLYFW